MTMTEWMIKGPEIATCNCDYSCPCQFNALPTYGDCRAAVAMRIDKGHYGKVKLDGLHWAALAAWPKAIHEGHGEILPIVDERATEEQRNALLTIMSGQDSEPGANFFQVFSTTIEKVHDPLFLPITFEVDMKSCEGHFSVPDVVQTKTHPIRNQVTGQPHHAKLVLREGFEFIEAEFAAGTTRSHGAITLDNKDKHAHIAMLHMTGTGIVH
jgi:hypothetical protein